MFIFTLSTCIIISIIIWLLLLFIQQRKQQQNEQNNFNDDDIDEEYLNNNKMSSTTTTTTATKNIERKLSSTLIKTITLQTCIGLYDEQMKNWRPDFYRYGTIDGLELTINYVDTLIDNNDNSGERKIIVAIHGVPGYYTHFDKLVEYYRNNPDVRVIVPNLPDFSHTRKTRTFWHTSIEKSTFLYDFLKKLNVSKIDCLICHSFGVQTAAAICEMNNDLKIKSIAFLSPQPLWDPVRNDEMLKAFKHKSEWWYNFLSLMRIHKKAYKKLRFTNINEFLLLCTIGIEDDTPEKFKKRLKYIIKLNIPIVLINGENERLISKQAQQSFNEFLKINTNDELIYIDPDDIDLNNDNDNNDNNFDKLKLNKKYNSFIIKNGGHFTHCNHHHVVNKILNNLLYYNVNDD